MRGEDGSIVREPSKMLIVVAPREGGTRARLDAIAAAYKLSFHQEAAGMAVTSACASF